MKTDTHPEYSDVNVKCSCGNAFTTRSTKGGALNVELCNAVAAPRSTTAARRPRWCAPSRHCG